MAFDENKAKALIGKTILVGVSYFDCNGNLESQQQLHGTVKKAAADEGILIQLAGIYEGEEWNMPPDTDSFSVAEPGEYNLKNTGEVVVDPDYLSTWKVHRPNKDEQS